MLLTESMLCSAVGALIGAALAIALVLPFTQLIESSLGLPYLAPGWKTILGYAAGTLLLTVLIGALSSAWAAWKLSHTDPGAALREGS